MESCATFPVPLYHGTSDICIKSIRSDGLGAINLSQTYKWEEFASRALILADYQKNMLGRDPFEEKGIRWMYERMAQQTNQATNFRHGGVYFSADYNVASRYAETAPEFIDNAINMLELLMDKEDTTVRLDSELSQSPLFQLIRDGNLRNRRPVLLKAVNVPVKNLLTERGDSDISLSLKFLSEYAEKKNILRKEREELRQLNLMNKEALNQIELQRLRELQAKALMGEMNEKRVSYFCPFNFECVGIVSSSQLEFAVKNGESWSEFKKLDKWTD